MAISGLQSKRWSWNAEGVDERFGLFRSPRQASKQIEKLADHYFLCHKLLGLESDTQRGKSKTLLSRAAEKMLWCLSRC